MISQVYEWLEEKNEDLVVGLVVGLAAGLGGGEYGLVVCDGCLFWLAWFLWFLGACVGFVYK